MTCIRRQSRRLLIVALALLLALGLADLGSVAASAATKSTSCSTSAKTKKAKKAKKAKAKKSKSKHKKSKKKSKKSKKAKKKKAKKSTTCKAAKAPAKTPTKAPAKTPSQQAAAARANLGPGGMIGFTGNQTTAWLDRHPNDPRTPTFRKVISSQPTSLWLTGDESFWNLSDYVRRTKQANGTMVLTVWNIPLRWDGIGSPSSVQLKAYRTWMTRIAKGIGSTRAILVLEPDALWFYDRLPSAAARKQRLDALRAATAALHAYAPKTRVYLEAGTTSGSVTPERMAELLNAAGVRSIAGFGVNVSSFSPTRNIEAYAARIRSALRSRGVSSHYVIDTSRNGAPSWDYTWCNPNGRRIGAKPGYVGATSGARTGYDYRLWIKGPGTSDGDCGNGRGSNGGDFLPAVAWKMIKG